MVRRGEIYLVSLDATRGREQRGQRPALVIQNDSGNEFSATTMVAVMSTQANAGYHFRVEVQPDEGGLREASTIMLDQIRTVDQTRLRDRLGKASPAVMEEVDRALHHSLGLLD